MYKTEGVYRSKLNQVNLVFNAELDSLFTCFIVTLHDQVLRGCSSFPSVRFSKDATGQMSKVSR